MRRTESDGKSVGEEWAAEIERRLAKIDAGEARLLSMDEVIARLRRAARGR